MMKSPCETHLDRWRHALASAIDNRVGGADAAARRDEVLNSPGERLLASDSPVRVVHSDVSIFVGGIRALLVQSMHPLAMAGVAQHSSYREDPWGRLQRTGDFLGVMTFGPREMAEVAVAQVRAIHERITGVASDGRTYHATDPRLLLWVHVAECESFFLAYQNFSGHRLDDAARDRYVSDMAFIAEALGAVDVPRSWSELQETLAGFRNELAVTPEAKEAARYLIFPPGLSPTERLGYAPILAAGVGLVPAWMRTELGLPVLPFGEDLVFKPAGLIMLALARWARQDVAAAVANAHS